MTKKELLLEIVTNNWKAKLACLFVGFLIWYAVKRQLNPQVDTERFLIKDRAVKVLPVEPSVAGRDIRPT